MVIDATDKVNIYKYTVYMYNKQIDLGVKCLLSLFPVLTATCQCLTVTDEKCVL